MEALLTTDLPFLGEPKRGKVREVYDLGDALLLVATDRISAFDVVMANGIPDKGRILNQMSAFWFERLREVCPNHVLSTDDEAIAERLGQSRTELAGRCTLARKAVPLTIECVARGYLVGSLWKEYRAGGDVHRLGLPAGLVEAGKLAEPIFSPATKAESGHDENISFAQACDRVGREVAETVRDWTLTLYKRARDDAEAKGLILADTKFEFGLADNGLLWIDEALTPDSSRFWDADTYRPGSTPPSYDKQFVRDYLETLNWNKTPPGPTLPEEIVAKTRAKYLEAFTRLTGRVLA
ncbi:MAG: phosphoribosylaminoimidazolesuccinocarboxamide synthase [Fimbriimonadaceae bacterium]|nr:phosphoribosylaminoimidazolesuccinocarboxamide synthase [Fimbriimonadaceae bacterium]